MSTQALRTTAASGTISNLSWVAADWGTSNLRVWAIDDHEEVVKTASSDQGMGKLKPEEFEGALLALIGSWLPVDQTTKVFACGMVGAKQGWIEAPYSTLPCLPAKTSTRAPTLDPRIHVEILPGICQLDPADVMRGEETQILGFLSTKPNWSGVICLPGTHCKWVKIEDGLITSFQTFLTGELFSAIGSNTVLKHSTSGEGWEDDAFLQAVQAAFGDLPRAIRSFFKIRADGLLHDKSNSNGRASLSGTLIGMELSASHQFWDHSDIVLLGADQVTRLYKGALRSVGKAATIHSADTLTLKGISRASGRLVKV